MQYQWPAIKSYSAYFDELEKSLEFIRETPELSIDEKRRFFKSANANVGESVHIMLIFIPWSYRPFNQASRRYVYLVEHLLDAVRHFIMYWSRCMTFLGHCGVVKAFLDAGLLPRVIMRTSAGGLIAALTCTRTDEELKILLVPELANRITACEDSISVWLKRFWKTSALFDSVLWVFSRVRFIMNAFD